MKVVYLILKLLFLGPKRHGATCIPPDPVTATAWYGFQAGVANNLSERSEEQAVTAASKKAAVIEALGGLVPAGAMMVRVKASNVIGPDRTSTYGGDPPLVRTKAQCARANNVANNVLEEVEVFSTGLEASCAKNLDIFESATYTIGSTFQTDLDSKGGGHSAAGDADSLARELLCINLGNNAIFKVRNGSNSYMAGLFWFSHILFYP